MRSSFLLVLSLQLSLTLVLALPFVARAQNASTTTPISVSPNIVADTMAERMKSCTVCHGKEGRATNDGFFPRIAGKPEGYLFNQLKHFRDGRRNQVHMTHLLAQMPDTYLLAISQYFSQLDLPYPAPAKASYSPAVVTRGEALVKLGDAQQKIPACVTCHGQAMMGMGLSLPGLLGLPRDYLVAQIGAWQTGIRKAHAPDCMAQVAKQLNPYDVAAVSSWLALQPITKIEGLGKSHLIVQAASTAVLQCGSFTASAIK